jgi:hypothetical protein
MGRVYSMQGREEVYGGKARRKRDHYKILDVYGMIVLNRILEKEGGVVRTGFFSLRTETSAKLL